MSRRKIDLLIIGNVTARIQEGHKEGHKFLPHTICEIVEKRLQANA